MGSASGTGSNGSWTHGKGKTAKVADCMETCQQYTSGNIFTIFVCVLVGSFRIGFLAPYLEAFTIARGAAGKIYRIIERVPRIDSISENGKKPGTISGSIKFRNVSFSYPSRPDTPILKNLSLDVPAGKTIALVGPSGCGKSTLIQLVQRFYDPDEGSVQLDGDNIKDLNLGWLRNHVGIVGQEPVLFNPPSLVLCIARSIFLRARAIQSQE